MRTESAIGFSLVSINSRSGLESNEALGQTKSMQEVTQRIRILRIIARMNVGGPAVQVTGITRNLDSSMFEQLLVTGYCEDDEIDYLDSHGISLPSLIKVEGLGRSLNFKSDIQAFLKIRSIIKNFKPDIIHTHTAKAGLLGRLASITVWRDSFRVHTFHGHLLSGYFSSSKTRIVKFVERFLSIFTDTIIGVGKKVVDDLVHAKVAKIEKFIVINPGLDVEIKHDPISVRNEIGIDQNVFVVSWVGRFADIKSPERVLEIARACKEENIQINFIMVGGGSLFEPIQRLSNSEDLPISFLGWRNDPEDLIAASDLLLMTSKNEGTPISAIQAQILGIPVLSTEVGSVNEIVIDKKTGFVVPYDPIVFAELILQLSQDKLLWSSQSNEARLQSEKRFTLKRLVDDHEDLYKMLMLNHQAN